MGTSRGVLCRVVFGKMTTEEVVKTFIEQYDYSLENINYPFSKGIDMPEVVRLYPHENRGEGQFVAVLIKNGKNKSKVDKQ